MVSIIIVSQFITISILKLKLISFNPRIGEKFTREVAPQSDVVRVGDDAPAADAPLHTLDSGTRISS